MSFRVTGSQASMRKSMTCSVVLTNRSTEHPSVHNCKHGELERGMTLVLQGGTGKQRKGHGHLFFLFQAFLNTRQPVSFTPLRTPLFVYILVPGSRHPAPPSQRHHAGSERQQAMTGWGPTSVMSLSLITAKMFDYNRLI